MVIYRYFLISIILLCSVYTTKLSFATTHKPELFLTPKEEAWLAEHPEITIAFDGDYAPYSYQDKKGAFQGIAVDFAREIARRAGISFRFHPEGTWRNLYQAARKRDVDVIATLVMRPEREQWFEFTAPYLSLAQYIITRNEAGAIQSKAELAGKTVALVEGYSTTRHILEAFPTVKPFYLHSLSEALRAVSMNKADATVAPIGMAQHIISQQGIINMRFADLYGQGLSEQRFGVRNDWPELASILDKALESISDTERIKIYQNWSRLEVANIETIKGFPEPLVLTAEEKRWLKEHPEIEIGVMDAWPPMDYVDDLGEPQGIGVDFIEALNKRLDGKLTIVPGAWGKIYDQVKNKQLDAVMDITPRKDREPYFNFTRPYANIPHVIVARSDGPYYDSVADLAGKTLALEEGFFIVGYLQENQPQTHIRTYASTSDALDAVSKGEADAYIGNRAVANYLIEKEILSNLQIQGKLKATTSVNSIGVRKDWPNLAAILDRALASLAQDEVQTIYRKWGGIEEDEALGLSRISLAPEEKAWLNDHPIIRVASDKNWAPMEFLDDSGQFNGISVDYLKRMSAMLGVEFKFNSHASWNETLEKFRNRELDIISAAIETEGRKAFAAFTKPYLSLPTAVFTLDDSPYIGSLGELAGLKVAAVRGYAVTEFLKREYPQIEIVEVEDIPGALGMLQAKNAFAYIGTFMITGHYIRKAGYTNLKATAETGYEYQVAMAARSDWPMLLQLLQKAMDAIDERERNTIFRKWTAVAFKKQVDYSLIYKIVVAALVLLVIALLWNKRLSREVAERKRAEKTIMESEERLKLALKGGDLGFWDVNLETGETVVNKRWSEMLEYAEYDLEHIREAWANSIHPDDRERILKLGQDYREGRIPDYEAEYRAVTKRTDTVWLATKGAIVSRNEHGAPVRMVGTVMDITERKKMETELFKAKEAAEEADRLKSAFLAAMSHELRTPLNSIIGFTGIMLQGLVGPLNDEQKKQLGMVKDSSQHLLSLINDVLDISKIEAGQLEVSALPFQMRELIEKVMRILTPMAEKKGLSLMAEVAPEVNQIVSDWRRVEQVLINLVNNALKFTEQGEVRVECRVRNGWMETRVMDTGIGIKPDHMSKLFKPFQQIETGVTRRYDGTGLGLSICKKLLKLLDGDIYMDSDWGVGSTFAFTLPLEKMVQK